MPATNVIPLRTKIHASILREEQKLSYRRLEDIVHIPKSTLHKNMPSFKLETDEYLDFIECNDLKLASQTLSIMFQGKSSARDATKVLNSLHAKPISRNRVLRILSSLGDHAENENKKELEAHKEKISCVALDEVFRKSDPILGGVDPHSSFGYFAFYGDRTKESWEKFLKELCATIRFPVSDGGSGLLAALKITHPNAIRIRDFFHITLKLTRAKDKLEGYCYKLLSKYYKSTGKAFEAARAKLKEQVDKLIDLFDILEPALVQFKQSFYMENPNGEYVDSQALRKQAQEISRVLGESMENGATHKMIKEAKTYLSSEDDIVAYKVALEAIIRDKYGEAHMKTILGYICPIIESLDQIARSYENKARREYWEKKVCEQRARFRLDFIDQKEVDSMINEMGAVMIGIKKSNSLIECVNSVIRRFLSTYRSIPGWFCSIFTYYWNHRRFDRGKRKDTMVIQN